MFTASTPSGDGDYIDMNAALNKLMIVRPLDYRTDFKTTFKPEGTDVVFCDIAVVDDVDPTTGQQGRVYRDQAILQGYLKGTFKRRVGDMIVGMLYLGPQKLGNRPFMWHDLIEDPGAVARAQAWVTANQSFLVKLQPSAPASAAPSYSTPATPLASGGPVRQDVMYVTGEQPPAYQPPVPVSAAPVTTAPQLTTLQQLKGMQTNHQGQPQQGEPPF